MAISANITGTGAGINKTGAGTLLLSGNNSFSGNNTVTAGTVTAAHDNALGTAAGATTTTVSSGATLGLQGGITLNALEGIRLTGTGDVGRLGALHNISGNNTVAGAVSLGGNTTFGAASGTTLTVAGAISQTAASTLTANGSGTIVLAGAGSYGGITTVNATTTLVAAADSALGNATNGTLVTSGGTLGFQGNVNYATAESISVSGTGAAGRNGAIDNLSGRTPSPATSR